MFTFEKKSFFGNLSHIFLLFCAKKTMCLTLETNHWLLCLTHNESIGIIVFAGKCTLKSQSQWLFK